MARVMLATSAERGHLNPMLGVAERLRDGGHSVAWLIMGHPPRWLDSVGVQIIEIRHGAVEPTRGAAMSALAEDPERLEAWVRDLLLRSAEASIDAIQAQVSAWEPDAIGTDPMLYGVIIAASLGGIPWAGISSSLNAVAPAELETALAHTVRNLEGDRAQLFANFGLHPAFRLCDCLSPSVNTVFATEALVGDSPLPPATVLVGPSSSAGNRGQEGYAGLGSIDPESPLVLCSFGSQIAWQPRVFRAVCEAVAPLRAQVLISGGPEVRRQELSLPGRVRLMEDLPLLDLLPRADLLITHGGANSVMEGLRSGVPLLVSPVCNDQFTQAWFVARSGVGRTLDLRREPIEGIRAALRAMLDRDGPERRRAREVSSSYASTDGAQSVVRRLLELAAS